MKIKKIILIAVSAILFIFAAFIGINIYISDYTEKYISDNYADTDFDAILVLGCGVRPNGEPSNMLSDRIQKGIDLCKNGNSSKIIMSGDHGRKDYDEVNTMKNIAIASGIASEDVFMDHAGFSTYDSMYRAKQIFRAEKILIVTQDYHLKRAVYIARQLGLKAYGVPADYRIYKGQSMRDIREYIARVKDFFSCIIKPHPKYLGETIPVSGNGNITNDK